MNQDRLVPLLSAVAFMQFLNYGWQYGEICDYLSRSLLQYLIDDALAAEMGRVVGLVARYFTWGISLIYLLYMISLQQAHSLAKIYKDGEPFLWTWGIFLVMPLVLLTILVSVLQFAILAVWLATLYPGYALRVGIVILILSSAGWIFMKFHSLRLTPLAYLRQFQLTTEQRRLIQEYRAYHLMFDKQPVQMPLLPKPSLAPELLLFIVKNRGDDKYSSAANDLIREWKQLPASIQEALQDELRSRVQKPEYLYAVSLLAKIGDKEALLPLLKYQNSKVRCYVAAELHRILQPDESVQTALIDTLNDIDPEVRKAASTSLQIFDNETVRLALRERLHDPVEEVRLAAASSLMKLNDPIGMEFVANFLLALEHDWYVRRYLWELIEGTNYPHKWELLTQLVYHPNLGLRSGAMLALSRTDDLRSVPFFLSKLHEAEYWTDHHRGDEPSGNYAWDGLKKLSKQGEAFTLALQEAWNHADPVVRENAIKVLLDGLPPDPPFPFHLRFVL